MKRLPIPVAALAQHCIALGKTRSGKSSKLRIFVEYLLEQEKPVTIIDPKGDWWGLKSSTDGRGAGFPIVIFGGAHADVPINEHSGAAVAELIATGNRPALIDMRGWMPTSRTRFFIDFASTLFKTTRGARYLVIDEVHNFAPKGKVLSPQAGEMLHWANRLASEGLGLGLTLLAASQRPQKVHNDLLTSCETLIACKVIHKADRDAIRDWIDGCADPAIGKQVIADLAQLKKPEAWVWSPEIEFGPERIEFPLFGTYDSFKPQPAAAAKLKGWAEIDLEDVKAKLATVVAEATANDPTFLKKRIAELEQQIAKTPASSGATSSSTPAELRQLQRQHIAALKTMQKAVDVATSNLNALTEYADHLEELVQGCRNVFDGQTATLEQVYKDSKLWRPGPHKRPRLQTMPTIDTATAGLADVAEKPPARIESAAPARIAPSAAVDLPKAHGAVLRALWWLRSEDRPPQKVAFYAGYSVSSSSFEKALGALRSAGLVQGFNVTDAGEALIADVAGEKPSGAQLREWVRPKLNKAENAFLDALINGRGERLSLEELEAATGYSITSSSFEKAIGALRSIGAAEGYAKDGGTKVAAVFLT
jgi:uncharacterized protein